MIKRFFLIESCLVHCAAIATNHIAYVTEVIPNNYPEVYPSIDTF